MRIVVVAFVILSACVARADTLSDYLGDFSQSHTDARAAQPSWSSPLITTTGLLEQRVRLDLSQQHAGNGADTTVLDDSRALDLIVGDSQEIQLGMTPYQIRHTPGARTQSGFADGSVFRFKQRLASSPGDADDYVVSAWLQVQAPAGIVAYTNSAWQLQPTLAVGKGWGRFDIQATLAGILPTSNVAALGNQVQGNVAFQYHIDALFWPELEVTWTHYAGGPRDGLDQVYLTPGVVVGRFNLFSALKFTLGAGYQFAVAPDYRPKPLTPAYQSALVLTSRVNF